MGIDFFGAKLYMMDPRLSSELIPPVRNPLANIMGDLLEYFEAQSRNLDEKSTSLNSPILTNFTSVIRFNGIPILPPVMTEKRREEMLTYRRQAMKLENRRKSKQREKLVARVQSIVADVEEKRNNRLSESLDSSPVSSGTDVSSKWSPDSANTSRSPASGPNGTNIKGGNRNKNTSQNADKKASAYIDKKETSEVVHEQKTVKKTEQVVREQRTKIPAPVQNTKKTHQKTSGKAGSKSQGKALTNLKKSSSMSSLPNPAKIPGTPSCPIPKPPSTKMTELQARRSNLLLFGRISYSNPDLRDIDDDNSLSCKSESGVSRSSRKKKSKSAWQQSNQHSASDPDISRAEVDESQGFVLSPEDPVLKSPQIARLQKKHPSGGSNPELSSTKCATDVDVELLRREATEAKKKRQVSESSGKKGIKKSSPTSNREVRTEVIVQETKSDEPQSLNDLPSLDDLNSLPQEFSGLPLTSVKQQQIGQVLAKLSKCLNLQDTGGTLNSTSSSSSTENNAKQAVDVKTVTEHKTTNETKQKFFTSPTLHGDDSRNSGNDGSVLNQSNVSSSVMSSVGSVGTNQSKRMSPKGLKNTVHFSSFITEISTSASQSVEDKISVRKMDITPSNSVDLSGSVRTSNSLEAKNSDPVRNYLPKNANDLGSVAPQVSIAITQSYNGLVPGEPGSMLSRVALSPEESPGSVPKTFFKDQEVPFHSYSVEIEQNTSDKENENIYQKKGSLEVLDKLQLLEKELNENCEQTYGNIFMLTGKRSVDSDDRSQGSTLKESQENVLQGQRKVFQNGIYSDANKTDFEKVLKVSSAVSGSSGHLIGDVNSQSGPFPQGVSAVNSKLSPTVGTTSRNITGHHVRHGSYTLDHPSEALLKSQPIQQNVLNKGKNDCQTRMNIGPESMEPVSISQNDMSFPTSESSEQNAKAEHIQRYLSQVQNHSSADEQETSPHTMHNRQNTSIGQYEISEAVKSFTETLQSMEALTEEQMVKIQAEHFNKIRQHLIEQQKQQLEELFVNQRREQLNLQVEIEEHHKHLREQQELFSSFSEPNNLSQFSVDNIQNTSIGSYNGPPQNYISNNSVNSNIPQSYAPWNAANNFVSVSSQHPYIPKMTTNNYVPNNYNQGNSPNSYNHDPSRKAQPFAGNVNFQTSTGYVPTSEGSGYVPTTAGNGYVPTAGGNKNAPTSTGNWKVPKTSGNSYVPTSDNSYFQNSSMISDIPENVNQPVYSQNMPANYSTQQKQFSYVSSPSLYFNPKDRDNESDISTFSKCTPKQSLHFNHSTPSPKSYKPVVHSPVKNVQPAWTSSTMAFPEAAFDPRLQKGFDRISACAKGYLTRRLLTTEKVQEIVKTIDDTKCFARSFQAETPIKKGQVTHQDRDLLDRIIAQLQAALLDMHEIFFDIPVWERMQLIAHDRQLQEERRLRESGATTRSSVSSSQPRISSATLKAMERKRKAQEAEAAVFGDIRPRTAPPANQRCQRESMDIRALQPVHASHSHNTTHSGNTTARTNARPKTAPSQPTKTQHVIQHQQPQQTTNSSNQQATAAKTRKTLNTAKTTSTSTTSTATVAPKRKKAGKAWR